MTLEVFMKKYNLSPEVREELLLAIIKSSKTDLGDEKKSSSKVSEKSDCDDSGDEYAPSKEVVLCYGERKVANGFFYFKFTPVNRNTFDCVYFTMSSKDVSDTYFNGDNLTDDNFSHVTKWAVGDNANIFAIDDRCQNVLFSVSIKRKAPKKSCIVECDGFQVHSLRGD